MAIEYERVNWDTTKYVNPTNMNQMDAGIKAACDGVDENSSAITAINSTLGNKSEADAVSGDTAFAKINSLNNALMINPTNNLNNALTTGLWVFEGTAQNVPIQTGGNMIVISSYLATTQIACVTNRLFVRRYHPDMGWNAWAEK